MERNMIKTVNIIAGLAAVTGVGFAAVSFQPPASVPGGSLKRSGKAAAAVDTLEVQLQRRFHDHNNVTFGMERVLRTGARAHYTAVMDMVPRDFRLLRDDGKPAASRNVNGQLQVEIEPGHWIEWSQVKETMHPENDAEKQAIAALWDDEVAIYTAGHFDLKTGEPTRLKGPAYLRQTEPAAPSQKDIAGLAKDAWLGKKDAMDVAKDGWIYRIAKVKADDATCLSCHRNGSEALQHTSPGFKVNEPIGMFLIGTKVR